MADVFSAQLMTWFGWSPVLADVVGGVTFTAWTLVLAWYVLGGWRSRS